MACRQPAGCTFTETTARFVQCYDGFKLFRGLEVQTIGFGMKNVLSVRLYTLFLRHDIIKFWLGSALP